MFFWLTMDRAQTIIEGMPKVELHLHLLGAIRPLTLLEFAQAAGIETGFDTQEEMKQFFQYRDFRHFIEVYTTIIDAITDESQFERLAFEVLQDSAAQNIRYVELSFSSRDHVERGLDFAGMIDAINWGIRKARKQIKIEANIRIDLVRNEGPEKGMDTLDSIQENPKNIVSVDLGGSEDKFPPAPFKDVFKRAKQMGLHLIAHAGEAAGPESIWDAIHYLNVERIGHATTAIEDTQLMRYLKENRIIIEACPVSNVRTGAVGSINQHPIREFYDRGLMVTVNSDDPTLFNTDMNNEFFQLNHHLNFSLQQIQQLTQNALDAAFVPAEKKRVLQKEIEEEYNVLIASE